MLRLSPFNHSGNYFGRGIILTFMSIASLVMVANDMTSSKKYTKPPTPITVTDLINNGIPEYDYVTVTGFVGSAFVEQTVTKEQDGKSKQERSMIYPLLPSMASLLEEQPKTHILVSQGLPTSTCVQNEDCLIPGEMVVTGRISNSQTAEGADFTPATYKFGGKYDFQRNDLKYLDATWRPHEVSMVGFSLTFAGVMLLCTALSWAWPFIRPEPPEEPAYIVTASDFAVQTPKKRIPRNDLDSLLEPEKQRNPEDEKVFEAQHGAVLGRGGKPK
jgi:hypothetical protein